MSVCFVPRPAGFSMKRREREESMFIPRKRVRGASYTSEARPAGFDMKRNAILSPDRRRATTLMRKRRLNDSPQSVAKKTRFSPELKARRNTQRPLAESRALVPIQNRLHGTRSTCRYDGVLLPKGSVFVKNQLVDFGGASLNRSDQKLVHQACQDARAKQVTCRSLVLYRPREEIIGAHQVRSPKDTAREMEAEDQGGYMEME